MQRYFTGGVITLFLLMFWVHAGWAQDSNASKNRPGVVSLVGFIDGISDSEIVVLGEVHHKPQTMEFLQELIRMMPQERFLHIALEWPKDHQPVIDQFLNGSIGLHELRPLHIPNKLVSFLSWCRSFNDKSKNTTIKLYCIDGNSQWNIGKVEQTRDQQMLAEIRSRILSHYPGERLLILTGNNHAIKNIQTLKQVELQGYDRATILGYSLAHLLSVYTKGNVVSVKSVFPNEPINSFISLSGPFNILDLNESTLGSRRAMLDTGGSWAENMNNYPINQLFDYLILFE